MHRFCNLRLPGRTVCHRNTCHEQARCLRAFQHPEFLAQLGEMPMKRCFLRGRTPRIVFDETGLLEL